MLSTFVRGLWVMSTVQNVQGWSPTEPEGLVQAMRDLAGRRPTRLQVTSGGHRFAVALLDVRHLPLGVQFTGNLSGSASGTTLVAGISGTRSARLVARLALLAAVALIASAVLVAGGGGALSTALPVAAALALILAVAVVLRLGRLHRELLGLMQTVFVQGLSVDQGPR